MTPEEAKKRADELRDVGDRDAVALRTLADALREAQAAVVQMREDAAKIADGVLDGPLPAGAFAIAVRISKAIRSLPAPAARTYDDGVRDQWRKPMAQAGMEMNGLAVEVVHGRAYVSLLDASAVLTRLRDALLSPAPAVAPVAQKTVRTSTCCLGPMIPPGGCAFDTNGTCDRPKWTDAVAPVAVPKPRVIVAPPIDFSEEDAPDEKPVAFDAEAALVAARDVVADWTDPVRADDLLSVIDAALAAGRGAR